MGKHIYFDVKDERSYQAWAQMYSRVKRRRAYGDVSVCPEWGDYEVFRKWFDAQKFSNSIDVHGHYYSLDKDILNAKSLPSFSGIGADDLYTTKEYSPENCVFVPQSINMIFKRQNLDSKHLAGVNDISSVMLKSGKVYQSRCYSKVLGKLVHLGCYETPEEAHHQFKLYRVADLKNFLGGVSSDYVDERVIRKISELLDKAEAELK